MKEYISVYRKESTLTELNREMFKLKKQFDVSGVIDLLTGSTKEKSMKMVEDSTHILLCGFEDIQIGDWIICNGINNRVYEVTYPDNPMGRNHHLEVELKFLNDTEIKVGV